MLLESAIPIRDTGGTSGVSRITTAPHGPASGSVPDEQVAIEVGACSHPKSLQKEKADGDEPENRMKLVLFTTVTTNG